MDVEQLTPYIGARVSGLDLADVRRIDREDMRTLLEKHLVLFFTNQTLNLPAFKRFGEAMADLEVTPFLPTLGGELEEIHSVEAAPGQIRGSFSDQWHSDVSCRECPPYGSILRPDVLPALGGDTLWASMYAAYEALPDTLRRLVDDLDAVHLAAHPEGKFRHESVHPIVRVNPVTGARGLYVNGAFTKSIVGMTATESAKLLELLYTHIASPDFQVRLRWTHDIVAVWDNRFTQHYAVVDYSGQRRMLRMTMAGDRPLGLRDFEQSPATHAA